MTQSRLLISRVPLDMEKAGFLVYDTGEERLVDEISDYVQELQFKRQLTELTVHQGLNHLVEFWGHLHDRRVRLTAVSDTDIEEFRDENYKKVRRSPAHRGSANDAKVTVNEKLYRIYDWLVWLQRVGRLPVGTVGLRGLITAIVEAHQVPVRGRGRRWARGERKYPLLFRVPNANAKHDAPANAITDAHTSQLIARLVGVSNTFVGQRDVLFVDIADSTGFRRGSICSLSVAQFELKDIEKAKDEFLVKPPRQKFGYEKTFTISLTLAYRIRQFIDDYWTPWVEDRGIPTTVHQNRLFLSSKTRRPMTDRAMTQRISKAFRALGFDKGTGPHKLRGKFASEASDNETAERLELGLDTSNWSIAAAIAPKLGHEDPSQFYRYATSSQSRLARIAREGRLAELKTLREENKRLKEEAELLKKAVGRPHDR
jgi:site-specific recombinase XerD